MMGEKSLSDNGERESMATDARRLVADGGSDDGLVTVESDADVETSVERVKDAIESNDDLGLMAEFDHEANADSVDRDLQPTTVLVFGNPDLGTRCCNRPGRWRSISRKAAHYAASGRNGYGNLQRSGLSRGPTRRRRGRALGHRLGCAVFAGRCRGRPGVDDPV